MSFDTLRDMQDRSSSKVRNEFVYYDGRKLSKYSCLRCRKLKKKCTRELPKCSNCVKGNQGCHYLERKNKRKISEEPLLSSSSYPNDGMSFHNNNNVAPSQLPPILDRSDKPLPGFSESNSQQAYAAPRQYCRSGLDQSTPAKGGSQNYSSIPGTGQFLLNRINQQKYLPVPLQNQSPSTQPPTLPAQSPLPPIQQQQQTSPHKYVSIQSILAENAQINPGESPNNRYSTQEQGNFQADQTHRDATAAGPNAVAGAAPATAPATDLVMESAHSQLVHAIVGSQSPTPLNNPPVVNRDLAMTFIKAYLDHNHKTYPFLDEREFMKKVDSINFNTFFDDNANDLDASLNFEVNMIMAIGCTTLERAGLSDKKLGYSGYFSSRSVRFLSKAVTFKDDNSVRALILLGVYSFFDPKGLYSWSIVGMLTRLAVSLGINRRVREVEAKLMSLVDVEMRHRLFWAVYNMDRLISISFGRPVAIQDDDINVPLPEPLYEEEFETLKITKNIIEMRRIEGNILTNVHCVRASEKYKSEDSKQAVLSHLRQDIEKWYSDSRVLSSSSPISNKKGNISFLGSTAWFSARYYHLLMLLYRPSYLFPKPSLANLEILGKSCLHNLSFTYNLYTANLLPLNWITLYRFLTTCTTILYCLCHWSIDLVESKTDIHLCVEILNGFSENWYFAKRCAEVFKTIDDAILEISLSGSNGQIQPVDQLLIDLMNTSSSYHEILFDNSVDIWYGDDFLGSSANTSVLNSKISQNKT